MIYACDGIIQRSVECPLCSFLAISLLHLDGLEWNPRISYFRTGIERYRLRTWELVHIEPRTWGNQHYQVHVLQDQQTVLKCYLLSDRYPSYQPSAIPPHLKYRQFFCNDSMIDPSFVRNFIMQCCCAFGTGPHSTEKGCGRRKLDLGSMDIDLIDVERMCLVTADSSVGYCALSYVWGQSDVIVTTKQNRSVLRTPGSIQGDAPLKEQGNGSPVMATVVQDAIRLVKLIGERYLWVDSLCITQDDAAQSTFYINRMDYIYSQALVTIVASASTSAMSALPGVRPHTRPPLHSHETEGIRLVRHSTSLTGHLSNSTYETRAWTFQERLLSKRCVIITESEVFLSCPTMILSESQGNVPHEFERYHPLRRLHAPNASYGDMERVKFGSMLSYRDLVIAYTKKQLTYDTDILRAFGGISSFLESKMTAGRMIYALPTQNLALALTWIPIGPTDRRTHCTGLAAAAQVPLPSWTWAGWTGRKVWPPPLSYSDAIKDVQKRDKYCPIVRRFHTGPVSGANWRLAHILPKDIDSCSSLTSVLKFKAWVLPANALFFIELNDRHGFTKANDEIPDPVAASSIFIKDSDGEFRYETCTTLEINYTCNEYAFIPNGGLIYGASLENLASLKVALVALAFWKYDGGGGYDFFEARVKKTGRNQSISSWRPGMHAYAQDYNEEAYFVACLVVKWTGCERHVCERIGVAHVSGDLWQLKTLQKTRQEILLI